MEDDVRSASRAGVDDVPLDGATPRVLCLVPTDDAGEVALERALELAGPEGAVVLFYRADESGRPDHRAALEAVTRERYTDDDEGIGRARTIADRSPATLAVWHSATPALGSALLEVVQSADISAIVLPASGRQKAVGDHVLADGDSLADSIVALFEKPVFADAVEHLELHVVDTENDSD